MAFFQFVLCFCQWRLFVFLPKLHVHHRISLPVIGFRQKRLAFALTVGVDPIQQELVPLVQMHEYIAEVFVPTPMCFLAGCSHLVGKCRILQIIAHSVNKYPQLLELPIGSHDQILFRRCSCHISLFFNVFIRMLGSMFVSEQDQRIGQIPFL